ncbi:MAG: hypothetical protein H6718_13365 [Polyangiaceae bacterium]|nr:hypothetical protein [Polyangiaceae bacterium]
MASSKQAGGKKAAKGSKDKAKKVVAKGSKQKGAPKQKAAAKPNSAPKGASAEKKDGAKQDGARVYTSRTRSPEDLFTALESGYKSMVSAEKEIDRRRAKEGISVVQEVLDVAVSKPENSVGRWLLPRFVEYLKKGEILDPKYDALVHPWEWESLHPVLKRIPNDRRTALFQRHFERLIATGRDVSMYDFEWNHLRLVPDLAPWILQHYYVEHRQKPHEPLEDEAWKKLRKKIPSIDAALRAHAERVGPKAKAIKPKQSKAASASRFRFKSTGTAYGPDELDGLSKLDRAQFLIAAEAEAGKAFKKPSQYAKAMAKELEEDAESQGVETFEVTGEGEGWVLWHFPSTDDGSLFESGTTHRVSIVLVSGEFLPLDERWTGGRKLDSAARKLLEGQCAELSAAFSQQS